jgi:hypothetical protein
MPRPALSGHVPPSFLTGRGHWLIPAPRTFVGVLRQLAIETVGKHGYVLKPVVGKIGRVPPCAMLRRVTSAWPSPL